MSVDTISAIATASGIGSVAIVRVSGSMALDVASKITHGKELEPRIVRLITLYDAKSEMIDEAIVIYFKSPFSFTGEDIVEFQCHGGAVVAREILKATLAAGARVAMPGEFSKRAFLNGKIDMSKAEAIAKLIEAQSLQGAKMLVRQLKGELGEFVDESRDAMLKLLAHSEVMIDYSQEDIPEDIIENLVLQLDELYVKMNDIVDKSIRRRGVIDGFRVAIIGKPNSGKSSLLNGLLSYDRAIVSDEAGTTRDTIEESMHVGSHTVRLIDTAGIRDDASSNIEKIGIERSIDTVSDTDIVIVLFDSSREIDESDEKIIELIEMYPEKEFIIVLSKSDLKSQLHSKFIKNRETIVTSMSSSYNEVVHELETRLETIQGDGEVMLVSARQIEAVERCMSEIMESRVPLEREELELFSYHIQEAIKHISTITRAYSSEEILDKMFGEFCLGK